MSSNLTPTAHRDVVQRALAFEPTELPFHGLSLLPQGFVLGDLCPFPCQHIHPVDRNVDDGSRRK